MDYLKELFKIYKVGAREESYYPVLLDLFKEKGVKAIQLPKKTKVGFPDIKVFEKDGYIIGYIEAKNLNENLEKIKNSEQLKRYISYFPNLLLTNFLEFIHFFNGKETKHIKLISFEDFKKGDFEKANYKEFEDLINDFLNFSQKSIETIEELAKSLAWRVRLLKDEILKEVKTNYKIKDLYELIKKYIIHTLKEDEFADTIAQSLAYALLIIKINKGEENLTREDVLTKIPPNLSILRDIFLEILKIQDKEAEWIIDEIIATLNQFDTTKQKLTPDELTIHFYEPFLKEYNPNLREIRGVYYTPKPAVKFIVKSVEKILDKNFQFNGYLEESLKLLDPASGTLTFILEVLEKLKNQIKENFGEGFLKEYFENYILNNFYAFELLPAPYVIGHLKVGKFLNDIGIKDKKFKLYLTNTLEFEHNKIGYLFSQDWAKEIEEADKIKKNENILVIIGNPPYSGISANNTKEINKFLKEDIDGCQSYYKVDGKPLDEKNPKWLQDDYVKFIRFAQWKINKSGKGVIGYITNHSYIDNPTFRGMRQSLLKTFDKIFILDLHGNKRKREPDENIFDIMQGVAIGIFVKDGSKNGDYADVYYLSTLYDLNLKTRQEKFELLENNDIETIKWHKVNTKSPFYYFKPIDFDEEYEKFLSISDIFQIYGVGITTARDKFVIDFDKSKLLKRILDFKTSPRDENLLHTKFNIPRKKGWNILKAWDMLQNLNNNEIEKLIVPINYRPFDNRYIFWHKSLVWRPVERIMSHMLAGDNLGLVIPRQVKTSQWKHIFIANRIIESSLVSNKTSEIGYLFPLYLYTQTEKIPNFTKEFLKYIKDLYKTELSPEEILYYIYAVLYDESYRKKYQEELKHNFPRIPFPDKLEEFKKKAQIGKELVKYHLLDFNNFSGIKFEGKGENTIEKISYKDEKIYINKTQYFYPVKKEIWEYKIGAYQVLKKWLSDRKGRKLSFNDLKTYMKIIKAIEKTIEITEKNSNIN